MAISSICSGTIDRKMCSKEIGIRIGCGPIPIFWPMKMLVFVYLLFWLHFLSIWLIKKLKSDHVQFQFQFVLSTFFDLLFRFLMDNQYQCQNMVIKQLFLTFFQYSIQFLFLAFRARPLELPIKLQNTDHIFNYPYCL